MLAFASTLSATPVGGKANLDPDHGLLEGFKPQRGKFEKGDFFKELNLLKDDAEKRKEAIKAMDVNQVIVTLLQRGTHVVNRMNQFRQGVGLLAQANKEPYDKAATVAIDREFLRLQVPLPDLIKGILAKPPVIDPNQPEVKEFLINELMFMNMNELLVAYGIEMVNLSNVSPGPVNVKGLNINDLARAGFTDVRKALEAARIDGKPTEKEEEESADFMQRLAMARVQASPAYKADIEANWTKKVGDVSLEAATEIGPRFEKIYGHAFSSPADRIDPDTTEATRSFLRAEYAASILTKIPYKKSEEWRNKYIERRDAARKAKEAQAPQPK